MPDAYRALERRVLPGAMARAIGVSYLANATNARRHGAVTTIAYHMVIARTQTLVQLTDGLVALLDERAARERRSRSTLIREALEQYLSSEIADATDRAILEGYGRVPATDEEDRWAERSAREAIRAEPW